MNREKDPKGGVGSEVVLALILLVLLVLLVHFLQPEGRVTESSSASESHTK